MALIPSLRALPTLVPVGQERPLPTESRALAAGVLADGDVGVLYSPDTDGPPQSLFVQRFTRDGRPDGDPIDLGTPFVVTAGWDVEGLSGGGLVAVYSEAFTRGGANRFAVADADGDFLGSGGIATDLPGSGTGADAAALPGGGFAFLSASRSLEGEHALLTFQRFTAQGDPVGQPLTVAEQTGPLGSLQIFQAPEAVATDGGVRVFWHSSEGLHTAVVEDDGDVADRRLLAGDAAGSPDAARLEDGRVVATWSEGGEVVAAVFDDSGPDRAPTEIAVGDGAGPSVAALDSGGWAVSWFDDGENLGRAFTRDGRGGPEVEVRGGFIGTDPQGEILALRADTNGQAHLSRYAETSGFQLPDLPDLDLGDRVRDRLDDLFARLERDWAF